jgi:hypothetical protein
VCRDWEAVPGEIQPLILTIADFPYLGGWGAELGKMEILKPQEHRSAEEAMVKGELRLLGWLLLPLLWPQEVIH